MLKGATARRYAEAVFELGVNENAVDRWFADLRLITEYFGDHRLTFLLSEPNIQFNKKELVVRDLLTGKVQPEALNLALLLVERGLVELVPRVRDEYERKYNDYHNQVPASLTTAMPLDDQTRAGVVADLQRLTGKNILLKEQVDPAILGGAIARVGDTLIDGSVRRRLQLLRQQLQRGGSFTSQMDGVTGLADGAAGADGASPVSPDGQADAPFVVSPNEPDVSADGGSTGGASATEMAPRRGQSPHMAPRQPGKPSGNPSGNPGNPNSNASSSRNSNNTRKRGRRR